MEPLPRRLNIYIAIVAALAAGAAAVLALLDDGTRSGVGSPIAWVLMLGMAFTGRMSLHLLPKTKVAVDTVALVTVALVLAPGHAMLATAIGIGAAHVVMRKSVAECAFNTAQSVLCVGVGSAIVGAIVPSIDGFTEQTMSAVAAALIAVVVMHGLSTLLVAAAGALQIGQPVLAFWRDGLWRDLPEQAALALVGIAIAATVAATPFLEPVAIDLVGLAAFVLR